MSEPMAAAPAPAPEQAGLFEDFIDIFIAPAKVFARRVAANSVVPWLIVSVLLGGLFFASKNVMEPVFEQEIGRQLQIQAKANPALAAPEAQEKARAVMKVTFVWSSILGAPILLLLLALLVWAVGKAFGATLTYNSSLMVTSYAWVPRVLASVLTMVQLQVMDANKISGMAGLSFGPARFLDADSTSMGLLQLAMRCDVFVLWTTVLIGVGFYAAGKLSKEKSAMAAAVLFVLGCLPAVWALIKGT
ncbi:MAG: YIP1 family protein [Gemmatimonadetes bacterium]|nr:YIP1 family protein [Gemmatimonadota bacterium]